MPLALVGRPDKLPGDSRVGRQRRHPCSVYATSASAVCWCSRVGLSFHILQYEFSGSGVLTQILGVGLRHDDLHAAIGKVPRRPCVIVQAAGGKALVRLHRQHNPFLDLCAGNRLHCVSEYGVKNLGECPSVLVRAACRSHTSQLNTCASTIKSRLPEAKPWYACTDNTTLF